MYKKLFLGAVLALLLIAGASAEESKAISHRIVDGTAPINGDPVILDAQEDVIAYDSTPQRYFTTTVTGTQFAVRFTPIQACTLSYLQIVTYDAVPPTDPGTAQIHIYADDGGVPGADLISPFTATLNCNLSYQLVNLPSPVDIGANDFHVAIEYIHTPPPYVVTDADGVTENRSQLKAPSSPTWQASQNDICFRAWVIYYGTEDLVPPVIEHARLIFGYSDDGDHPFTAEITDAAGIASATIHYSLDGATWFTSNMTNSGGDTWDGTIPAQDIGSLVLYYLSAIDGSTNANEAFMPPDGANSPYTMEIVRGHEISYSDNTAEQFWIVSDVYDNNAFATRMTPSIYPVQVLGALAFVNDDGAFNFTVNGVFAGLPDTVLTGGEALVTAREAHGWGVGFWPNGPVIENGSFYLLFHWLPATPDDPGVGQDTANILFRSYWYNTSSGWNMVADGEWLMKCIVASPGTGIWELDADGMTPAQYRLLGNYPNPFNPSTHIKFLAPVTGRASVEVYNITGQLIKTVFDENVEAGIQTVTWDGTDTNGDQVSSGIYFYKLSAGDQVDTRKMILMK